MFANRRESSISYQSISIDIGAENDESDDSIIDFQQKLFGPQLQLLDYRHFKAARTIQRHFRGWRVRQSMKERQHAATVLQRCWRQFISKRHLISTSQERLQENVLIMFNNASMKIQAFFRGSWVRKHINNVLYLKKMQLHCMEDILTVYAYKMHTMMRTQHLPGYMSICKNSDINIVKDLIEAMSYRFYNQCVGIKHVSNRAKMEVYRREFADCAFRTRVPYVGFNHMGECHPSPPGKQPKTYTLRENYFVQSFTSLDCFTETTKKKLRDKEDDIRRKSHSRCDNKRRFCKDLVKSMRFWPMCNACKVKVTDSLLGPGIGDYLDNVKASLEAMHQVVNCNCKRDTRHEGYFPQCQ